MRTLLIMSSVALMAVLSSCTADSIEDNVEPASAYIPNIKSIETEVLEQINAYRLEIGLQSLQNSNYVKNQAYNHTHYMIEQENLSHDNFFKRKAYLQDVEEAVKVSENVAFGYSSALSVVNAWIKSDGHREIIEGDFTHFDISAETNTQEQWYYTLIFIRK